MSNQLSLNLSRYPDAPGFKKSGTSSDAAKANEGRANKLRLLALAEIAKEALTADEVAERLGKSVLSIRPRISELSAQNLIEETGERRFNDSGHKAAVWRIKI